MPRPFASADPRQNIFMNQLDEPWYNQPLPADLKMRAVINALAHGQQQTVSYTKDGLYKNHHKLNLCHQAK